MSKKKKDKSQPKERAYKIKVPVYTTSMLNQNVGFFENVTCDEMIKFAKDKIEKYAFPLKSTTRNKTLMTVIKGVKAEEVALGRDKALLLQISAYNTNFHDGYFEGVERIDITKDNKIGKDSNFVLLVPRIKGLTEESYTCYFLMFIYEEPTKQSYEVSKLAKRLVREIIQIPVENTTLQGVADVQDTLDLADDIFRTEEILFGDIGPDLVQPDALGVGEEFHFRMVLADGGRGVLAGRAAPVVRAGGELMLHAGIDQNEAVAFRIEREVLVLHRLAVQADEGTRLAEQGRELVHDAALDAAVIVLGALADSRELELVDTIVKNVVQGEGEGALEGGAGTQAGAQGHVAREHGVEALHLAAALDGLAADAENVARPLLLGLVLLLEAELHVFVVIEGVGPHFRGAVDLDRGHDAAIDGAREDVAAVIIRMFADQVDASRGGIYVTFGAEQGLEFFLDFGFHIVIVLVLYLSNFQI